MIMERRPVGQLLDAVTRAWVRVTGRREDLRRADWLAGPTGDVARVGDSWLDAELVRCRGRIEKSGGATGLLPSMSLLDGPGFDAGALRPEVRDFYERTSQWRLQVWAQWCSAAWPFGWLVSVLFARRLEQLSLPLRPLDVAHGMSSDVRTVVGPDGGAVGTSWHRRRLPGRAAAGSRYGMARRIPVHERFRVHVDAEGVLRTDHSIDLWRLPVLRLHYRLDLGD